MGIPLSSNILVCQTKQGPSDRRLAMTRLMAMAFVIFTLLSFNSAYAKHTSSAHDKYTDSAYVNHTSSARVKHTNPTPVKHTRSHVKYIKNSGNLTYSSNNLIKNGNNLIYDAALNITWYYDPNLGAVNWDDAMKWAENLVIGDAIDWQLPSATGNELGLLYAQLRNTGTIDYFTNLQSVNYWTSTLTTAVYLGKPHAYAYSFTRGVLGHADTNLINGYSAIAVHSGNVGATQIPEPAILLLLGSGLAGIAVMRKRIIQSLCR